MATVNYPLTNNDLYVSDFPKEILEYYILTQNKIDSNRLKNLKKEDLDDLSILVNQYHLVQYCDTIETVFPMDVLRCDYHYENIDGQRVIGNFYVPHFFFFFFKLAKEQSISDDIISELCALLDKLPTD